MIVDANAVAEGAAVVSDVCIVGAGAAGITLALALARRGLRVTLLESGGLEPEAETQRLYEGSSVGAAYSLTAWRLRYFGGTTNHWGGLCRALDPVDFLPLPWVAHSGWPIAREELDPYYEQALAVLEIPPRRRFAEVERDTDAYPRLLGPSNAAFEPLLWLKSPPTRMGKRYREDVAQSPRVDCYLHANAVELVVDPPGRALRGVKARTLGGRRFDFSARRYVLAAGGIENARLLLLSDAVVPGGIGNRHDLVGRYFMEHMTAFTGSMIVASPPGRRGFQEERVQARSRADLPGVWDVFFGFGTLPDARRHHRLLGFSVNALPVGPRTPTTGAVEELVGPRTRSYGLAVIAERAPNPASRVFLTDERDALGQRQIAVDLRADPCDRRSIRKSMRLFALEVARSGRGRVRLGDGDDAQLAEVAGGHHMGTTRMADDPARGVTDRNGKVHGIANLYVAGSSLFVTGGFANPTLTIVALTLRLADHLGSAGKALTPEVQ